MSTRYRILDRALLRSDLERTAFASAPAARDAVALEVQVFAVRALRRAPKPAPVGLCEPLDDDGRSLLDLVRAHALDCGCDVLAPGDIELGALRSFERGSFAFGHGGQIQFRSSACGRPAEAFEECARVVDTLAAALAPRAVELLSIGANPWHSAEETGLQDGSATAFCVDAVYAALGASSRDSLRLGAATKVFVGLGGPLIGPLRLRAARALAPIASAAFAFSPLALGAGAGHASLRTARRRTSEPGRTSPRPSDACEPPLDQYLEFALDARVLVLRTPTQWYPQLRPFSFRSWLVHGIEGEYPDLDDWRFHLSTLDPDVRPEGWIALDAQDAQLRPYWAVPLVFWSALLEDRAALAGALELGEPTRELYEAAARDGVRDARLGQRAKTAFALVAEALLRRPAGWATNEMLAAFVDFAARFVFRERTPADELAELFAARGAFDLAEYQLLARAASARAGASSRGGAPALRAR